MIPENLPVPLKENGLKARSAGRRELQSSNMCGSELGSSHHRERLQDIMVRGQMPRRFEIGTSKASA
jgi:hypothetical protein